LLRELEQKYPHSESFPEAEYTRALYYQTRQQFPEAVKEYEAFLEIRGAIRVPTVIVAVNYAKVPKKRPKLCARAIRERDRNRCQYTGRVLRPDEGSLDHVVPRSRGGKA